MSTERNAPRSEPIVSVIVPAYNAERTIIDTVASVLCQSESRIEVLVVDDGSSDRTPELVSGLSDRRLRLIRQENAGVSAARNRGAREARGRFLAFLDSDDTWDPAKIEAEVSTLEAEPDAGLAYCWTRRVDLQGRQLGAGGARIEARGSVFERLILGNFIGGGCPFLVRREVFERVGGFDESIRTAEDWDFYLRVARIAQISCVPRVLVDYRVHPGSKSHQLERHEAGILRVLDRALEQVPGQPRELRRRALAHTYFYLVHQALRPPLTRTKIAQARRFAARLVTDGDPRALSFAQVRRLGLLLVGTAVLPTSLASWAIETRLAAGARTSPTT